MPNHIHDDDGPAVLRFTCAVCGKPCQAEADDDGLMAEAEELFAEDVLGGQRGPACKSCRADFLAWAQGEGDG